MIYQRSNKQGNITDLINLDKVTSINIKVTDNIAKVKVMLDSGALIHMNMKVEEATALLSKMSESNSNDIIDKIIKGEEVKKEKK